MRCEAEGAFLQRVYWDVHEQKNAPTTKQIAAMNIASDSAPIAESGIKRSVARNKPFHALKSEAHYSERIGTCVSEKNVDSEADRCYENCAGFDVPFTNPG